MKILAALFSFLFSFAAMACPYCMTDMDNPSAKNVIYVLMIFIALTYIPFAILYRMIIKNRNFNRTDDGNPPSA
jgi:hypothetical protein